MKIPIVHPFVLSLFTSSLLILPMVADAAEGQEVDSTEELAEPATAEGETTSQLTEPFVANGGLYGFEELGLTIAPPQGWTVVPGNGIGPSLVFQEPKQVVPDNIKEPVTTYRRNVTLSIAHEPAPIDELTAEGLVESLKQRFSQQSVVSDYEITEYKIIELADNRKGLLVYAGFNMSGTPMMHMHVLVSNETKQFLQTYTDMGERFNPEDEGFVSTWNAMATISIEGEAPIRYQKAIIYGSIAGAFLILILLLSTVRGYRARRRYSVDSLSDSADSSSGDSWAISSSNDRSLKAEESQAGWDLGREASMSRSSNSFGESSSDGWVI